MFKYFITINETGKAFIDDLNTRGLTENQRRVAILKHPIEEKYAAQIATKELFKLSNFVERGIWSVEEANILSSGLINDLPSGWEGYSEV